MIEFNNVSLKRNNAYILKNASFEMGNDTLNILSGKSGVGKTSVLNAIFDLSCVESGSIVIDGDELSLSSAKQKQLHKKSIGYISQNFKFLETITVLDNLVYATSNNQGTHPDKKVLTDMLAKINLTDIYRRFPSELSGGERQRLAIGIALLREPKIILADEPTANLDGKNIELVLKLFQESHQRQGTCVVMVTHNSEIMSNPDFDHYILTDREVRART